MNALKIMLGMTPFFLFSVLSPVLGVGGAGLVGVVAALAVVATTARGGIKELPAAQGVLLLVMAIIGFVSGRPTDVFLVHYGPGFAGLALGLFMIATARTAPFTAQFARATVPSEFWHSERFLEVNRKVSTSWGLAVLAAGLCHLLAAQIGLEGLHLALRIGLNQVVPLLALFLAAAHTKRVVAAATELAHEKQAHGAHEAGPVPS